MADELPEEFLQKLRAVTAKRPKTVIDHILEHGQITTDELKDLYGYDHPPRAARDVIDQGIPLITVRVTGKSGRKIAAYRFGDPSAVRGGTHGGRKAFSKQFKIDLVARDGEKCAICSTPYQSRYLQIDHRIPYAEGVPVLDEGDNRFVAYRLRHTAAATLLMSGQDVYTTGKLLGTSAQMVERRYGSVILSKLIEAASGMERKPEGPPGNFGK